MHLHKIMKMKMKTEEEAGAENAYEYAEEFADVCASEYGRWRRICRHRCRWTWRMQMETQLYMEMAMRMLMQKPATMCNCDYYYDDGNDDAGDDDK